MRKEYEELAELGIDRQTLFECEHMTSSTARIVGASNKVLWNKKSKHLKALEIIQSLPTDTYEDKVLHGKINYVFCGGKIEPTNHIL